VALYDDAQVRAALARVWPDADAAAVAQVRGLGGGLNPRSFLVGVSGRRFVLRLPAGKPVALLDLATEARAMRAAAAAGIAPPVAAVDVEAGLLLTEYHAATPGRLPAIRRMTAVLRALHGLDVDVPVYVAAQIAARYLAALEPRDFTAVEKGWADELLRLARDFDVRHSPTAFCHNDLVAENVLDDGATLRLVDFEYAVRGAPLLDLAGLAGMNGFGGAARRELLAAYYGDVPVVTLADLDAAIRLVRLLAFFWTRMAVRGGGRTEAFERLAAQLRETLT
jgi:Ser/Thr protein kinase RdoA (MazF antagonist)